MKNQPSKFLNSIILLLAVALLINNNTINIKGPGIDNVPDVYKKVYGATETFINGNYLIIKANSLPNHKSPYYRNTPWEADKYEANNSGNPRWRQNPSIIAAHEVTYKIPLHPAEAATHYFTPLGPIGVAINGVPLFNQYAAGYSPLTFEVNSFDQYGGHPQQQGMYHYHAEPYYLTATKGKDALLGFLLDGFPVYGPMENGKPVTNADLDEYHGHVAITADYPNGIYHYHVTATDPYINGNKFYGTPGTITQ